MCLETVQLFTVTPIRNFHVVLELEHSKTVEKDNRLVTNNTLSISSCLRLSSLYLGVCLNSVINYYFFFPTFLFFLTKTLTLCSGIVLGSGLVCSGHRGHPAGTLG